MTDTIAIRRHVTQREIERLALSDFVQTFARHETMHVLAHLPALDRIIRRLGRHETRAQTIRNWRRWDGLRHRRRRVLSDPGAFWVSIGRHGREYGGPEEGGWWYDTHSPQITVEDAAALGRYAQRVRFTNEEAAHNYVRKLLRVVDRINAGRRSPSSCLYRGDRLDVRVFRDEKPRFWPATRPRYE